MTYLSSMQVYLRSRLSFALIALAGAACGPSGATETNVSDPLSATETNVARGDCGDAEPCEPDESDTKRLCKRDAECDPGGSCGPKGFCLPKKRGIGRALR